MLRTTYRGNAEFCHLYISGASSTSPPMAATAVMNFSECSATLSPADGSPPVHSAHLPVFSSRVFSSGNPHVETQGINIPGTIFSCYCSQWINARAFSVDNSEKHSFTMIVRAPVLPIGELPAVHLILVFLPFLSHSPKLVIPGITSRNNYL